MNIPTRVSAPLLSLFLFPLAAQAVSISYTDLPQTLRSGFYEVSLSSTYSSGTASAFHYVDWANQASSGWLMRYDLTSPSGEAAIDGSQARAFDGYLWMQVKHSYDDTTAPHAVTLFMDKVTPSPSALFGQNDPHFTPYADANGDLSLFVTTTDLLAGRSYATLADNGEYGYSSGGGLTGELPVICLAEGCQMSMQLNLAQLTFATSGTSVQFAGFNPGDTRGQVFTQTSAYYTNYINYGTTQTFAISAVPEPSAFWMFAGGLGLVTAVARRRRSNSPHRA
ncbi:MAG TPA: PEP-CTERM sorting domain-containing protein [Thiobacillus sp.]|nr:MAG: hypothetical protein B7Y50_04560 [Hydrogenophilales bacterium 28-61-11]OYZ58437.1 MAG: hypothetical protein B7Y21_03360 [Hydrogenophilales bacterium 16-61-112]OZA42506.1 MAG: hypothetical protein B7X81_12850 [Hydrogenophilales bacterium 17-61-76]HQT29667.1 PEP-CTERM sorting domain-containing protein [Thiobacillus sp.]HQT70197.1 PEP-CTERM sorting domain-containing protein [Thiobacillus sp.]